MLSPVIAGSRRLTTIRARRPFASKANVIRRIFYDEPSQTPLYEELPGLEKGQAPKAREVGNLQAGRLPNGVKIISQDLGGAVTSFGVYIKGGSRHELIPGASHVMEHMAFKSTQSRSALKLQRDVEDLGGILSARALREAFVYSGDVLRENFGALGSIVCEVITEPKLKYWELNEEKPVIGQLISVQRRDPLAAIVEGVHSAAYGQGTGLGHSVYASPSNLDAITSEDLVEYLARMVRSNGIVVAATNIAHEHLEQYAAAAFGTLQDIPDAMKADAKPIEPTTWLGGECLIRAEDSGVAHVALAFEGPSLMSRQHHALGILQALLGGSGAHGGGAGQVRLGPQRHSRIARSLHGDAHSFIHSLSAFGFSYTDSGILGLAGSCADHEAAQLIDVMFSFVKEVATGSIEADELARAKKQYQLAYLHEISTAAGLRDHLGFQQLHLDSSEDVVSTVAAIERMKMDDVVAIARAALMSKPAIAAIGSLASVMRYDQLAELCRR